MKRLQNTLYVTSEDTYLSLDGENVVVRSDNAVIGRVPLHNLENIVSFGYRGASPRLMSACAERGVGLCFLSAHGRFLSVFPVLFKAMFCFGPRSIVSPPPPKHYPLQKCF